MEGWSGHVSCTSMDLVIYYRSRENQPLCGKGVMKGQRLSLGLVIGLAAGLSVIYVVSVMLQSSATLAFGLCALAILATAWMAIRILKDPDSTDKSFDDEFYQDREDLQRKRTR